MMTWAVWFENANRTVAKTVIVPNKVEVSTVFLGLDHNFREAAALGCEQPIPILFESLVFGGDSDGHMDRYHTWDEAEAGHLAMVADIKSRMRGTNVTPFPLLRKKTGKR